MLLRYLLNDSEMVSFVAVITRINFVFTFHVFSYTLVRSIYFRVFLTAFLIPFLSPEIAASINVQSFHYHAI
jgi:hypothetical protein